MQLDQATKIAECVKAQLAPHCDRIEIAGSIRRRKAEIGDIEIVCIPRTRQAPELFGDEVRLRDPAFIMAARELGRIRKGCLRSGKYMQFWVGEDPGIQLDLFMAHPENWGLIFAIRTGSAEFSHHVLASGWVRAGFHSLDGMLCSKFHKIPVREEADLFHLINVPWIEPEKRG